MKKLYSEEQVRDIVLNILSELGIYYNEEYGTLEIGNSISLNSNIYLGDNALIYKNEEEQTVVPMPANEDLGKFCKVISTGIGWSNVD